jgi:hypothetical protein
MSSIFWDVTPCSPLKINRSFEGTCGLPLQGRRINQARNQRGSRWKAWFCLPPAFTLVCFLAYSSTLKMEATFFSETSVDFQRTIWRYIPHDTAFSFLELVLTHKTYQRKAVINFKNISFCIRFVVRELLCTKETVVIDWGTLNTWCKTIAVTN